VAQGPDSVPDGLGLEAAARDLDAEWALGPVGRCPRARRSVAAETAYWQCGRLSRIYLLDRRQRITRPRRCRIGSSVPTDCVVNF